MEDFKELIAVRDVFAAFPKPWFFCGGWAIDLFAGYKTREHSDVEIGVFREDQEALKTYLRNWKLQWIRDGQKYDWSDEEFLQLPIHEIVAESDVDSVEILLNEKRDNSWLYRRQLEITLPVDQLIQVSDNIPYMCPEVVLLYKSKHLRDKDEYDLETTLPNLCPMQRDWLKMSLIRMDIAHPWIKHFHNK